jgi:hypothetical protein
MELLDTQGPRLANLSAEAALLGHLINHPTSLDLVTEHLGPADFSNSRNSAIYSAICIDAVEVGTVSLASIVEQMRKDGSLGEVSEGYLHNLTKAACDEKELKLNAAIIIDLSAKREKMMAAQSVVAAVARGEDDTIAFDKLLAVQDRQVTDGDGFAKLGDTMKDIISGNYTRIEPTILRRSDGQHLIYAAKLSWVSAPPEALKSFAMLLASVQEMQAGRPVAYVDYEDDASTICERLYKVAVGQQLDNAEELVMTWVAGPLYADGSRDESKALFHYIAAGRAFDMKMRSILLKVIKRGAQLITIDGCASALAYANLNENDNSDVNRWISTLWPLTNAGAAVVVIDHVVKNTQPGSGAFGARSPRGAGSKLSAVSGAALMFSVLDAPSAYSDGKIEITVAKDRPGRIRVQKRSGKRLAGVLMSKPMEGGREGIQLTIHPAEEVSQMVEQKRFDLVCAEHISKIVKELGPISKTEIRKVLKERADAKGTSGFRTETTVAAMKFLADNGYVRMEKNERQEMLISLIPYEATHGDKHADDIGYEESPF